MAKAVSAVGDIMNVTLVPFGNARFQDGKLECQHGADECTVNSFEQCAITLYPKFSDHWPYYLCIEQASASCGEGAGSCVIKHTESCAHSASLDYSKLWACVNDPTESLKLQHKFAKLTPDDHEYVPWVVVDGKLSKSDGDKLTQEVCKAYKGTKPAGCLEAEAEAVAAVNATFAHACPVEW
jgi:interferon, gamma-inducible protein 30